MSNVKINNIFLKGKYFFKKINYSQFNQKTKKNLYASFLAIFCSFFIAIIIACLVNCQWSIFGQIIKTIFCASFSNIFTINNFFSSMAILIVAGLAFIFAFKIGLFNIGISGQMIMGATVATFICHHSPMLIGINQVIIIVIGAFFGFFSGAFVGFLKAFLNVNEVVSSIMLNWIIYFMSILLLGNFCPLASSRDFTAPISDNLLLRANINNQTYSFLPLMIIALLLVCFVYILMKHTVFGKKLTITGMNKFAATAFGYNVKTNLIITMGISGLISGILGIMVYCGFAPEMPATALAKTIPQEGFNGISIGLIAMSNPLAIIPVSVFFALIQTSGDQLQTLGISNHLSNIIFGIVVYGAATIVIFLNFKPYQKIKHLFHKADYWQIIKAKNIANYVLFDIVNDYQFFLKKYYVYNICNNRLKSSLHLTFWVRAKKFWANVKYKIIYFWCAKICHFNQEKLSTNITLSLLQNQRIGLTFRYDITNFNKLIYDANKEIISRANSLEMPKIKRKSQFKQVFIILLKVYDKVTKEINVVYQKLLKHQKPNLVLFNSYFMPNDIYCNEKKIKEVYFNYLKEEIRKNLTKIDFEITQFDHEYISPDKNVLILSSEKKGKE